jgi:4-amino-4-deoxy-L-arabinose transferase-like glycosyltransferase
MKNHEKLLKWVLIASAAVLSLSLGHRALWDPDESRYAEIAREILVLHDWVTPHLNYLLYFEKPMLYMWLLAISFKIFGVSESSAHLVSIVAALGGVALGGFMAGKLWGRRAGIIASLILITSLEYFFLACAVDINMPLTLFITSSMVFFWFGHSEKNPGYYLLSWFSMALAVLTKGPIGIILPLGAICVYMLITRQWELIRESRPIQGILLFLVIALPWYILVSIRNPDFFSFFFVNQNLQRYAASREHNQPFFYFIPVILAGALPWTFLLPSAVKDLWQRKMPQEMIYLLVWFFFILFFFMPSNSKLATYVLPCFPPLAIILAHAFRESKKGGWPLFAAAVLWACLGISLIFFPILVSHGMLNLSPTGADPLVRVGQVAGSIILAGVLIGIWLGRKYDAVLGLSSLAMALMITVTALAPQWDSQRSTKSLVQDLPLSAQLFAYEDYYQSSNFYSKRQIGLVQSRGELDFGISHNSKKVVLTLEELVSLMRADKNVYCLTRLNNLPDFRKKIPDILMVKQTDKLCLLNVPR